MNTADIQVNNQGTDLINHLGTGLYENYMCEKTPKVLSRENYENINRNTDIQPERCTNQ
jgi:hypothetical protein